MSAGFGTDTFCLTELKPGRRVSGTMLLAQAAFRRITTPRGTCRDGAQGSVYGIDLAEFIGEVGDRAAIATVPAVVRAELSKDDRFASVTVRQVESWLPNGDVELDLEIDITPADGSEDFSFTASASQAGVAFGGVA